MLKPSTEHVAAQAGKREASKCTSHDVHDWILMLASRELALDDPEQIMSTSKRKSECGENTRKHTSDAQSDVPTGKCSHDLFRM